MIKLAPKYVLLAILLLGSPSLAYSQIVCPEKGVPQLLEPTSLKFDPDSLGQCCLNIEQHTTQLKSLLPQMSTENNFTLDPLTRSTIETNLIRYKNEFKAAMRANPKEAFKFLPKADERIYLNFVSQNCLPEPVKNISGTGWVEIADDFQNQKTETRVYFTDKDNNKKYVLYASDLSDQFLSGQTIVLSGYKIDNEILVSAIEASPAEESLLMGGGGSANPDPTAQRIIAIKATPQELPEPDITRELIYQLLTEVKEFYNVNSFGKMTFEYPNGEPDGIRDVYPHHGGSYSIELPYTCSKDENKRCDPNNASSCGEDKGSCRLSCSVHDITRAVISASDSDITFTNNTQVAIFLPSSMQCPYAGRATLGTSANLFQTKDSPDLLTLGPVALLEYKSKTIGHEFGHTYGIGHAMLRRCKNSTDIIESCIAEEYGNNFDVMGIQGLFHHNAVTKIRKKWLLSGGAYKFVEITPENSGKTLYLSAYESLEPGIKAIMFRHRQIDSPILTIEFRQPLNFDAPMSAGSEVFKGALLHTGFTLYRETNLLDPTPPLSGYATALLFNSSYTDPGTGSVISVGEPNEDGLLPVTVTLGRTDFEGPLVSGVKILSEPEPCIANLEIAAQDPSGISRVIFTEQFTDNILADVTQAPFQFKFDNLTMHRPLRLFVYDDANVPGSMAENNFTEKGFVDFNLTGACGGPPKIKINSPKPGSITRNPVSFDVAFSADYGLGIVDLSYDIREIPDSTKIIHTKIFPTDGLIKDYTYTGSKIIPPGKYRVSIDAHENLFSGNFNDKTLLEYSIFVTDSQECLDNIDNDGDTLVDAQDPDCEGNSDPLETPGCSDNFDNDNDGREDMEDPGCLDPADSDEKSLSLPCDDGLDNDNDSFIDYKGLESDPDCKDFNEKSEASACSDGIDNDIDGTVDFPQDRGCINFKDDLETDNLQGLACDDGYDNDHDQLKDFKIDGSGDPGCDSAVDTQESNENIACDDLKDNDLDGAYDYPGDTGCLNQTDHSEKTPDFPCDDGFDNDRNGVLDYSLIKTKQDPNCLSAQDPLEQNTTLWNYKIENQSFGSDQIDIIKNFSFDNNPRILISSTNKINVIERNPDDPDHGQLSWEFTFSDAPAGWSSGQPKQCIASDLDNNNKTEIICVVEFKKLDIAVSIHKIYVIERDLDNPEGGKVLWSYEDVVPVTDMIIQDLNHDNRQEIIKTNTYSISIIEQNSENPETGRAKLSYSDIGGNVNVLGIKDINNDRVLDIIVRDSSDLKILKLNSIGPGFSILGSIYMGGQKIFIGMDDFNGNGQIEFIVFSPVEGQKTGELMGIEYDYQSKSHKIVWHLDNSMFEKKAAFGNELGLRNPPLLITSTGDSILAYALDSQNPGLLKQLWQFPSGIKDIEEFGFADLDQDGDNELIIYSVEQHVAIFENSGTRLAPQWKLKWQDQLTTSSIPVFEDMDGDGDQDLVSFNEKNVVVTTLQLKPPDFIRGDTNGDGKANISDAILILNWLFSNGVKPVSMDAADVNDAEGVNIADPVYLLKYLFLDSTTKIPAPFPSPGQDPTPDNNE